HESLPHPNFTAQPWPRAAAALPIADVCFLPQDSGGPYTEAAALTMYRFQRNDVSMHSTHRSFQTPVLNEVLYLIASLDSYLRLGLVQEPLRSVFLHFFVLGIPQDGDHVSGGQKADSPSAIVVSPGCLGSIAASAGQVRILEPIFVDAPGQHEFRVLIVRHEVLFVGDHEVANASRNGVIRMDDLHLEGPDLGMPRIDGALDIPIVLVRERHVATVVISEQRSAFQHPLL